MKIPYLPLVSIIYADPDPGRLLGHGGPQPVPQHVAGRGRVEDHRAVRPVPRGPGHGLLLCPGRCVLAPGPVQQRRVWVRPPALLLKGGVGSQGRGQRKYSLDAPFMLEKFDQFDQYLCFLPQSVAGADVCDKIQILKCGVKLCQFYGDPSDINYRSNMW